MSRTNSHACPLAELFFLFKRKRNFLTKKKFSFYSILLSNHVSCYCNYVSYQSYKNHKYFQIGNSL
jgi:hypothetical protein